jgi:hypothetical protein
MNRRAQAILRLDAGAACAAGFAVLALRDRLALLHAFPLALVVFLGASNLAYASYSGSLATLAGLRRMPSRRAIDVLVVANLAWTAVCGTVLVATWRSASVLGLAHVAFEGLFVGALAVVEYRLVRPQAR